MIAITDQISIEESEIREEFILSAGPGGQNINKVSTAVRLRFNALASPGLPASVKERLVSLAGRRITANGELIIESRQHRSQEQNRQAALERLVSLLRMAAEPPRPRHKTRPTRLSQLRRLEAKRQRGLTKRLRQSNPPDE